MASRGPEITFVVPGQAEAVSPPAQGKVRGAVRVGVTRDGGKPHKLTARPGEDVVELTIANGPTLVLSPESARDLLRAQAAGVTRSAIDAAPDGEVVVSGQLGWPGLEAAATRGHTRGWLGQATLAAFKVLGLAKDPAVSIASAAITRKLDGAVDAGVYKLSSASLPERLKGSGAKLQEVPAPAGAGPLLVMVHGTFVDTVSSFGRLWELHPQVLGDLFGFYQDRVYALDHPTMGVSPIANALTLASAMPPGARLHLLTHSRGGLVAEILARACAAPLSDEERALFADPRYARHLQELDQLIQAVQTRGLKVERIVRVACPARGTLLASGRLDAYLSVLRWSLELAGLPVAPELVDFLQEVARRRADPTELPGLEALMPESPLVAWLNAGGEPLPGDLRVIAGDLEGDSVGSWVKTLLSDAFYWTDNDLIVQTRSMYGGGQRSPTTRGAGAQFLLDRGGKVSHFNYFANERTVAAISRALTQDMPQDFEAIGPLSWAGQDASGLRSAKAVARSRGPGGDAEAAQRPAVFVLPGILGSNLKVDGKRIWLGFRFVNGLKRLAWDPGTVASVQPDGPIDSVYEDLIDRLADTHEVIPFAYDWRRPIEDEARRLADAVDRALTARASSGQPVRLIAHSMGGLVARTMQLERPQTWQRMMAREGARLLMLGTPNGGSWAPMQTLSGDDTFGNSLVAFGSLFDNGGARKMMAGMPGFIQLQAALLDPLLGLDRAASWQKLADDDMARLSEQALWHNLGLQRTVYEWGAPPQSVLDQAVQLRKRLDAQAIALGDADARKMLLVVGHDSFTPAGISFGADGLTYVDSADGGDGRVVLSSALLPGVRAWRLDAVHGKLPDVAQAFPAYVELLVAGDTQLLERLEASTRATTRGAQALEPTVHSRPSRGVQASRPPSSQADIFGPVREGAQPAARSTGRAPVLQTSVYNGDLKFVREPLLLGHYRSIRLTGTELAVDGLVNKSMSRSLDAGLYPDAPGSNQIFGNSRDDPDSFEMARPRAAIVAGLGEEGKLTATHLVHTVRQAILAYAQRVAEQDPQATGFDMAVTLMGSGGTGITAGSSAQQVAQGALDANLRLQACRWPVLRHLQFVELFLERAADAWRALQLQQAASQNRLRLVGMVQSGPGALKRPLDSSYRGSNYDFISALAVQAKDEPPSIAYTLDTKRARTEVRAQHTQSTLLRELVEKASNDANQDRQIGRTLFNLLVPVEMEPFLAGNTEMVIEVNPGSAVIPWELLDTNPDAQSDDKRPWSIRTRLIRKLRLDDFRGAVSDASAEDGVLVIGEPKCDRRLYPPLPGAREEARAVADRLEAALPPGQVKSLLTGQDEAKTIINALFERAYRIVHVAGHGSREGGVVLSGRDTYLGANEVRSMRTVPELVFLNCCHLAARDTDSFLQPYDRAEFAANIAEELIRAGVRCVIAAGWAVEDGPAKKFATTFYSALLGGARFIEAVSAARSAAWEDNPNGNTWAAYQCYGDPEWSWRRQTADGQKPAAPTVDPFASVASPVSLDLALEYLATSSEFASNVQERLDQIKSLELRFAPMWGGMGAIAEAFGVAYARVGQLEKAIEWYRVAVDAPDGSSSFRAAEQLGNLLVRRAEKTSDEQAAARDFAEGVALLEQMIVLRPTAERHSLLGAAHKRMSMTAWRARQRPQAASALASAIKHYGLAEDISAKTGATNLYYPAMNCIACEVRQAFLKKAAVSLHRERISQVRKSLQTAAEHEPDFWSVVGLTELAMLEALAEGRLVDAAVALTRKFGEHKARVPALLKWDSVYTSAQFVLEPYLARATPEEKRAANDLLKLLEQMRMP